MKAYTLVLLAILAGIVCVGVAGCSTTQAVSTEQATSPTAATVNTQPVTAPTFVMLRDISDAISMDPVLCYEIPCAMAADLSYETLVDYKPGDYTNVIPGLAQTWEVSPDGTTFTFHLNPKAKFASGSPVTAEDVRFTFTRFLNVKGSPAAWIADIKDIEVVDPATVKITLTGPSAVFLPTMTMQTFGIQDSKVVKEHGGTDAPDAAETDKAKEWLDQNSAGSGRYTLVKFEPNVEIVFKANPNYWGGTPKLGQVVIKHVSDPTSALQLVQRGDADLLDKLDVDLIETAKADPNLSIYVGETIDFEYLMMTNSPDLSKPLSDKRVRHAIAYAIDYDGIINGILKGYAKHPPSIFPLGMLGVDANMVQGRDVAQAKALLKEAGYESGFTIDLPYWTEPHRDAIAAKIKQDLSEVGITVNLKPQEFTVWATDYRAGNTAFTIGMWATDLADPANLSPLFAYADAGMAKRAHYSNPEAERLADLVARELDPAKRKQAMIDLQKVLMDDMPFASLFQWEQVMAFRTDVKGVTYVPGHILQFGDLSK